MTTDKTPSRTRHVDPRGFAFEVPAAWKAVTDPQPEAAFVAVAPEPDPWGFRTNVVLTLETVDRGMTLAAWQNGADLLLPQVLKDYLPIDREDVHVGSRSGLRRLGHHDAGGRSITIEQWCCLAGREGCTLTASVSTLAYPAFADELAAIGQSFRFGPEAP